MISRLDVWIGKNVFQPPIIRICQIANCTQYHFANYAMMAAFILLFYNSSFHLDSWSDKLFSVLEGFMAFTCVVLVALRPGTPYPPKPLLRYMWWLLLIMRTTTFILSKGQFKLGFVELLFLFSEYARTIDRIPPRTLSRDFKGKVSHARI